MADIDPETVTKLVHFVETINQHDLVNSWDWGRIYRFQGIQFLDYKYSRYKPRIKGERRKRRKKVSIYGK